MKFYGLKNCDTCRKALKELEAAGKTFTYIDVRADGVPEAVITGWLEEVGADTLINKRSTTWRGLSDAEKGQARYIERGSQPPGREPDLDQAPGD